MPKAHVVIDYQNIHLTGHGLWCPEDEPAHLCLTHPLHFANQVILQRNLIRRLVAEKAGTAHEDAILTSVHAFRGQPSNERNPTSYRRTQAQRAEWTRDDRVTVTYRALKYYADGSAKEKGIDVLVALKLVTLAAQATDDDIVILAAHDTDQEPAIELAYQLAGRKVETAGWESARILRVKAGQKWHTKLHQEHFEKCIDRRVY